MATDTCLAEPTDQPGLVYCPRCDPQRQRPYPAAAPRLCRAATWTATARRYAGALARWTDAGRPKVDADEYARRLDACRACPHYDADSVCRLCRCHISAHLLGNKAEWATERCPIGRWPTPPVRTIYPDPAEDAYPTYAWITTDHLERDTHRIISALTDRDTLIAIPRSGLLPAQILAHRLNLPLFALTRHNTIADLNHGTRSATLPRIGRKIAVVDDTTCTGRALTRARTIIHAHLPDADVITVAVYAASLDLADVIAYRLPAPHLLDWHFPASPYATQALWDIDGVLLDESDHTGRLLRRTAPGIHCVTGRGRALEPLTREQLARAGINPARIDYADKNLVGEEAAEHKARIYAESPATYFVESDAGQALTIARISRKIVICPPQPAVYVPQC